MPANTTRLIVYAQNHFAIVRFPALIGTLRFSQRRPQVTKIPIATGDRVSPPVARAMAASRANGKHHPWFVPVYSFGIF
jgi:hypothetical protein